MTQAADLRPGSDHPIRSKWGWFVALGIALVVGGFFVVAMPYVSSMAVTLVVGVVLMITGVIGIIQAFQVQSWGGFFWHLLLSIVMLVGGIAIYFDPVAGLFALTIMLAAIFVAQGVVEIIFAFTIRPESGWGWMLAAGIVSLIAGVLLWNQFPSSAAWALGLVAGVSIIFNGWSYIAIGLAAREIDR